MNLNFASTLAILGSLLFLGLFSVDALAQSSENESGSIVGKVVDSETGKEIIGANVIITDTSTGDATDVDGNFTIKKLEPGTYSVTVSYVSYSKKTITDIEVEEGEATRLEVSLDPESLGLDEVSVTADAISDNEAGLLSIQRKSISFQDGLSSEYIGKTGDSDVAQAMRRVTGVSLVNRKDVFVRGLGNRYSNVQLNGSAVPSTSPTKKEAPLDLINSSSVDNIVVQKTFTADQSGEFSGGSVQITSLEFPSDRNVNFSYSTSYNSVSTFENTLSYPGGSTDFIGFDDGKRSLPAPLTNDRMTLDNRNQVASSLHPDWGVNGNRMAVPSQKIELGYSNQFNESNLPIGIVSNFSYKYDRTFQPTKEYRVIQSYNEDAGSSILNSDYLINEGKENAKISGMLNVFMKPNDDTKIGLKNIYSNSGESNSQLVVGEYVNYPNDTRQTVQDFDRRAMYSGNFVVEKYFESLLQSDLEVNIGYSRALRNRPDRRTTQYNLRPDGDFGIYFPDGGNTHFFSKQLDQNYSAKADYEIQPVDFVEIKTGFSANLKDRSFDGRRLEYQEFSGVFPDSLKTRNPEEALSPRWIEDDILGFAEITQDRDSYTGEQRIMAGYLSTNWALSDRLSLETGGRIENSLQEVFIENRSGEELKIANVDQLDFLPAVNATYSFSDKTNFRGAYSKTLARPEFREISDFRFQDFVGSQIVYGNPELNRTSIQNYDLRLETYPSPGELFAVSVFYKHFDDPIELFYRLTERTEVKYKNAESAELYGLELEGRKNLSSQLQLVSNASFILSETISKEEDRNRNANFTRPMYGQSPYTINLGAFYSIPEWNLQLSSNFNTFGERVVTVGMKRQPGDEYEQPFHQLELGARYQLGQFSIKAEVENLLNQDIVYEQGDVITNRYSPGMTYTMGVSLNF